MQTFILDKHPNISANLLDSRRAFKQAVEIKQIYNAITGISNLRYKNHPAVQQWAAYHNTVNFQTLLYYGQQCLLVSGYNAPKLKTWYQQFTLFPCIFPHELHQLIPYHRRLLIRKDYNYYQNLFPHELSVSYARYIDPRTHGIFHIRGKERIYE